MTPEVVLKNGHVFPLTKGLKPAIKWREGSRKGADSFPNHRGSFGLDCGKSGIVVLDVDIKNGKDGRKALAAFDLPPTYTVRTKSGGLHLYFFGKGRNSVGKLGEGLDVRGEGGYVVIYPDVVDSSSIAKLPDCLSDAIGAPAEKSVEITFSVDPDQPRNIARAAIYLLNDAPPAIEGDAGDFTTLKVAMRLKDMGLSEDAALDLMLEHWNERCDPEWDTDELARKIGNAYAYGKNPLGSATPEAEEARWDARLEEVFGHIEALPQNSVDPEDAVPALEYVVAKHWLATEPKPLDPVLSDFFERGDVVCVIGAAKTRKTWFVLQMAISIAAGRPFLQWEVCQPRRVLFVQFEVKADHFHRRFRKLMRGLAMSEAPDSLFFVNARGKAVTVAKIATLAKQLKADVVFLDPLYMLIHGDENKSTDIKFLFDQFSILAETTGAAVVFTHHDAKGTAGDRKTQDRGSGSGVLGRFYDSAATISDHNDHADLWVITPLVRNYKPAPPFSVKWEEGCFSVTDAPANVLTSKAANQNPTTRQAPENFIHTARSVITESGKLAINKTELIKGLRVKAGVTKAKAEEIIEAALAPFEEELRIFTNHGKGLNRKQILYAVTMDDLDQHLKALNAETSPV